MRVLEDDQLIALHEAVRTLTRDQSLAAALRLIAEKARQLTLGESAAVCLLDSKREYLDFTAVAGRAATEMVGQTVRVSDALTGHTALTGEPLLAYNPAQARPVDDLGKHPHPLPPREAEAFIASGGVRSAAIVPIFGAAGSVGSIGAIDRIDGESFTGKDLLILHILASTASAAIQQQTLRRASASAIRERDVLQEAARATTSSLNVQTILDGVLATLARSIDMFASCVFLLNDERTHLFIAADHGLTDEDREIQLLTDGKLASAALASGNAFIVSEPDTDPRFEQIFPGDRPQPLSWIIAPLVSRENQMGLLVIGSLARNAYALEDLRLASSVASLAAVAMENAELYEDATRRTEEATAIYELSQAVNTNLNLHRVLNFVADSVLALLHVDKFALFLHNPQKQCLEIKVARNIRRQAVHEMRPDRTAGGIAWWVFEYETPTAVQSVEADHRNRSLPIDQEGVASLVSVPLQAGDDVIGVIHAMSTRRRSFTVREMELLYTIANQVGVAISNIQIIEDTRQKSEELRRASRRVARALGTRGDIAQTGQTIVDLAAEIVRADKCLLYAVDSSAGELILRAAHGVKLPSEIQACRRDDAGRETSAYSILRKARSIVAEDPAHDSRFVPPPEFAAQLSRSGVYIGLPLKIGAGVVGVLEVYLRDARSIPTDELRQYVAFTAHAAVALQNALLVGEAGRRKQDLDLLVRLAQVIAEGAREELAADVLALLISTLGADGALLLVKPAARTRPLRDTTAGTAGAPGVRDGLLALGRWSGEHEATIAYRPGDVEGGTEDWRSILAYHTALSDRPFIAAPMLGGALCLIRIQSPAHFDANDVQIVETVARVLGPAAIKAAGTASEPARPPVA